MKKAIFLFVLVALVALGAGPLSMALSSAAHDMVANIRESRE